MTDKTKYDGVFEGGGVKGIALIGALKRLEEEGVEFGRVAGTSAGAITTALVAAGYKADEIKKILWEKDFNDFANVGVFTDKRKWLVNLKCIIPLFFRAAGYGIFKTDNFYGWIKDLLKNKGVTDFKSSPVYLRVFAVDIVNQQLLQFDRDNNANLEIAEAVRMSMSIPFFFRANIKDKAVIVDGGVLANYPIATFDDNEGLKTTIGLKLISEEEGLPPGIPANIGSYIMRIFETMQVAHERIYVEKAKWAKTIPIRTGSISTIKFDLTEDEKHLLWNSGYDAASRAITKGLLTAEGRKQEE